MAVHDVIGDMLTKIRNASNAGLKKVKYPYSNIKLAISQILEKEGFIEKFEVVGEESKKSIEVVLKYYNNKAVISGLKRFKPGRRIYRGLARNPKIYEWFGSCYCFYCQRVLTGRKQKTKCWRRSICCVW